jgi:RNA polymerase sigma-70 factor (ECF subfamily)
VALAEVEGVAASLSELDGLGDGRLADYLSYHAVRADLLRRAGRADEARLAYDAALALGPGPAEAAWLRQMRDGQSSAPPLSGSGGGASPRA